MRSLISKGLDRAARYHDAYRADAGLAARSAGASSVGSLMTGGGSGVGAGRHISSPGNAADQYAYFSGYPYAIINVIANRLSAQPIRVARRLGRGGRPAPGRAVAKSVAGPLVPKAYHDFADELEVIPDHRINRLLDNPNELMVRHHLMYITFASLETTGRAYWWMFAGPNGDELWPLPTHWVEPVPGEERLFDFYRVSMPITGQIVRVPARQIVPFFFPDPSDPFGAYSPMQALARTVLTDHAYETAQRVSFQNGVNPGLAIIVGRPPEFAGTNQEQVVLTKEQRAQLVAAVKNQFRGVQKFDEPLILDALIKDVKLISPTPKEMAFKDSGPLVRDRLAQGFGMNPITLGEIEGANYASSGVADHHVCRSVFAPRTEMYSQTLTCYLPPYFGGDRDRNRTVEPGDLVVYQEPVVPSDPEMEAQREAADYAAAIISRNDIRRKRGLPPLHDGDNALTPAGWVPVLTEEQASQSRRPGGPKHFVPPAGKVTDDEGHEHGDDGGGGGGGDKPDKPPAAHDADHAAADHAAVHASWEAEDSARAARHSQEARDDTARQQAEELVELPRAAARGEGPLEPRRKDGVHVRQLHRLPGPHARQDVPRRQVIVVGPRAPRAGRHEGVHRQARRVAGGQGRHLGRARDAQRHRVAQQRDRHRRPRRGAQRPLHQGVEQDARQRSRRLGVVPRVRRAEEGPLARVRHLAGRLRKNGALGPGQ